MKISYSLNFNDNNEMWYFAVLVGILLFFIFWYNLLFKGLGITGTKSDANSLTISTVSATP
jgi:hypothetical protein